MADIDLHDPGKLSARQYYGYQNRLAHAFVEISKRGILVDTAKMAALRAHVQGEISAACARISAALGGKAVVACAPDTGKLPAGMVNLASPKQILDDSIRVIASLDVNDLRWPSSPARRERRSRRPR